MTASLSTIASVTINRNTKVVSRASFGVLALMCFHSLTTNLVDFVSTPEEVLDLGADESHPAYLAALRYFQQPNPPEQMAICKRGTFTQILHLTPIKTTAGYVYSLTVTDPAGLDTLIEYEVQSGDTVDDIVDGLAALIDPLADMTAAGDAGTATKLVITATAGKIVRLSDLPPVAEMTVYDATVAGTAAADVSAVLASLFADRVYAFAWDRIGEAEAAAAAAVIQAADKIQLLDTSDSEATDAGDTDDMGSQLKALSYSNSSVFYLGNSVGAYQSVALAGKFLGEDPGTENWAHKSLVGIVPDDLLTGQQNALKTKNVNYYVEIGGLGWTLWGKAADGDYLDVIRGVHWLKNEIAATVVTGFYQVKKVPFTDPGIAAIESLVRSVLERAKTPAEPNGGALLASYTITVPKASAVSQASKARRELPGIVWTAVLQGAVNKVFITGTVGL